MGFRFRRQIKIFPGIRINVSKNHLISSITIGGPKDLLKTNIPVGRNGNVKMTAGNFGGLLTGLSFEHQFEGTSRNGRNKSHANGTNVDAAALRAELEADHKARMEALEREHEARRKRAKQ